MKRTKQSTFARRERSEKSTGFAPVGGEDMTHTTKHTPTGEVMAHFNLSDEEWDGLPSFMQQKLATVYCQHSAAPAMYEALHNLLNVYQESTDDNGSPVVLGAIDALAQAEGR